jgi:type II secretory pathway predicted ATPase ExeA
MFETFYQLREQPFGNNPDPRFLYLSKTHREAYASLLYRIHMDAGFLAMVAQPGMGKTTLLFHLLNRLQSNTRTAFIFHTQCTSHELLRHLLSEFECDTSITDPVRISRELKSILLAEAKAGRRCVLIIDEAQNLEPDVLETIRLLSNFETPSRKLLNIILSGQAELGEVLSRPGLQQLRQRLSCIVRIETFAREETDLYILNRLRVAGYQEELSQLFTIDALDLIAQLSHGIPRIINNICFNALSLGYASDSRQISLTIVEEVACDLGLSSQPALVLPDSVDSSVAPLRPAQEEFPALNRERALTAITSAYAKDEPGQTPPGSESTPVATNDSNVQRDATLFLARPSTHFRNTPELGGIGSQEGSHVEATTATCSQPGTAAYVTEQQDERQENAVPLAKPVDCDKLLSSSAGLLAARACLCAVLLFIAPAIDGPSRHSVSAERAVAPVSDTVLPNRTVSSSGRKVTRSAFVNRRHLHSDATGNSVNTPEVASHGTDEIRQIWEASHDPEEAAHLKTSSSSPRQLMEPLPFTSIPTIFRAFPGDGARPDFVANGHPTKHYPANKAQPIATCREDQLDGSRSLDRRDSHAQPGDVCSFFSSSEIAAQTH